jgi:hypothetical protein
MHVHAHSTCAHVHVTCWLLVVLVGSQSVGRGAHSGSSSKSSTSSSTSDALGEDLGEDPLGGEARGSVATTGRRNRDSVGGLRGSDAAAAVEGLNCPSC